MNMIKVASGHIYSIGYENNTLYISFDEGGLYAYYNVPQDVYSNLMKAFSKGEFFHNNIKNVYDYEKLEDF